MAPTPHRTRRAKRTDTTQRMTPREGRGEEVLGTLSPVSLFPSAVGMCRFMVYTGVTMRMADLLTHPDHCILKQSYLCKERLTGDPLNGDGWGVGWYVAPAPDIDPSPCLLTSVNPAWNDRNLTSIAEKTHSRLVFAHVRAATSGLTASESNCHPFSRGRFMFMHNGNIGGFRQIKRRIVNYVTDDVLNGIQGTTDSEYAFALFLNEVSDLWACYPADVLCEKLMNVIRRIKEFQEEAGVTEASLLNFALTDGDTTIVTRLVMGGPSSLPPASLYFASGTRFECDGGNYRIIQADRREQAVIVASEPLTEDKNDWIPIPPNHLVMVAPPRSVLLIPISMS